MGYIAHVTSMAFGKPNETIRMTRRVSKLY